MNSPAPFFERRKNDRAENEAALRHHRAVQEQLRLQREANEQLLLAGLKAVEEVDVALVEKRRAEDESIEAKLRENELRATAQFRERLLGIVGHDLRNPLNSMVMAAGLLIARGGLSDEDARLASRIVQSGQRMTRIISQLVEFTRERLGGGVDLHLTHADLGDVVREVVEELRVASLVSILFSVEGDVSGQWDVDRLSEAFSNIVGNAVDHASPRTSVVVSVYAQGDVVVADVSNQGEPIPPDALPVIFNAFRQGEVNSRAGHLGLGLYIASQVVRSHGGLIEARSADGTTMFSVRLPRER